MMQLEETMLKLSESSHNHHHSGVKLLAKSIRRGIWEIFTFLSNQIFLKLQFVL